MLRKGQNRIFHVDENTTRWDCGFKTPLWKFFSLFMKPMFKKQTMGYLKNFKKFVESET